MKLKEVLKDLGDKFDRRLNFIYIKRNALLSSILGIIICLIIFLFSDIITYIILYIIYFSFVIIISELLEIRYKPIYVWVEIDPDSDSEFVEGFLEISGGSMNGFRSAYIDASLCSICKSKLHNPFPKDFPDEYKICCECDITASFVYQMLRTPKECKEHLKMLKKFGYVEEFKDTKKSIYRYNKYKEKFDNLFIIKKSEMN